MVGRRRIVNIDTVPGGLGSIRISVHILQLIHIQLALTPLHELLHDVVVAITGFLTTLGTAVEVVHAGEHVQLLVRAHDITVDIEDVLIHRAVGQIAVEARVGIADTEGTIVKYLRDRHVVGERDTCLEEFIVILVGSAPGRGCRIADLAVGLPLGQVVPRQYLTSVEFRTPALVHSVVGYNIGYAVDHSLAEVIKAIKGHVAITATILLLELRQFGNAFDTHCRAELNAESLLLLSLLRGDHDHTV